MHGKIKLKLDDENYRNEKYMTQTAWMKSAIENYTNIKLYKVKVYEWKLYSWKVYE